MTSSEKEKIIITLGEISDNVEYGSVFIGQSDYQKERLGSTNRMIIDMKDKYLETSAQFVEDVFNDIKQRLESSILEAILAIFRA